MEQEGKDEEADVEPPTEKGEAPAQAERKGSVTPGAAMWERAHAAKDDPEPSRNGGGFNSTFSAGIITLGRRWRTLPA